MDLGLQGDIHLQSALQFNHQGEVNSQAADSFLHEARYQADIASRETAKYFGFKSRRASMRRKKVLPSFWYVPNGIKAYLDEPNIDPWDFDSHLPRFDIMQRSMSLTYLPIRQCYGVSNFI